MPAKKNLALRVEHQADHIDMIYGTMLPDYLANTEDATARQYLEAARGALGQASELLRQAASRMPRP